MGSGAADALGKRTANVINAPKEHGSWRSMQQSQAENQNAGVIVSRRPGSGFDAVLHWSTQ